MIQTDRGRTDTIPADSTAAPGPTGSSASLPDGLLVAWYGDDFTGSAAVMEVLTFAGLPTVLFFDTPTQQQLARFAGLRGVGIASTARTHGTRWMDARLPAAFARLRAVNAPISHYKVCSTLDSSPDIGSIGRAIDIASQVFDSAWIPVLIAAPPMQRFQIFGNLFASGPGGISRLDRHPVMSRHPVTPMDEADVARHLSRQTGQAVGLIDWQALQSHQTATEALQVQQAQGRMTVTLDCLDDRTLAQCGRLIWENRSAAQFTVGSQGIEYALVRFWQDAGMLPMQTPPAGIGNAGRMAVVSGSVSPVTASQIDWSLANGFEGIRFQAASVIDAELMQQTEEHVITAALQAIDRGLDPLIYTARGPDDPAVTTLHDVLARSDLSADAANLRIGTALGRILDSLIERAGLKRAVISGGDTSGHACRQLDIYALTALAPTIPGAALFHAHSEGRHDGLQLALKGGQMGSDDYFGWVREGGGER